MAKTTYLNNLPSFTTTVEEISTLSIENITGLLIAKQSDLIKAFDTSSNASLIQDFKSQIEILTRALANKKAMGKLISESKLYTESDLVSLGEYLLSEERRSMIQGDPNVVYHSDLENWKEKQKNK